MGFIEGRYDFKIGRKELDKIIVKYVVKGKVFIILCYFVDG